MDFFSMKRKKLQSLCKKHGIPANLKNKDMADKLSLIYKEEKNENPGSRWVQFDVDKSNVEIIVLDSDSDSEVQMEALDTVAEKDSNEKTNVSTGQLLDEEPDQSLTTSPRSEVKSDLNVIPPLDVLGTAAGNADRFEVKSATPSDLNIHHMVDSGIVLDSDSDSEVQMEALDTVAEKDSNEKINVSTEQLLDEEPDQSLTTSPRSEVKSDLNVIPPLDVLGTAAGNADRFEVKSATPSDLNIHHMVDSGIVLDSDSDSEVQMEALDTVAEKDSNEKTNVSTEQLLDEEPDQSLTTSPRSEVKSDLNVIPPLDVLGTAAGNADRFEVKSATPSDLNIHHMVDSEEIEQVHQLDNIHVMDEAAAMCLDASTAVKHTDEVKVNDLNNIVSHPLQSDAVAEKDSNEKTNAREGHLVDKEPEQFLTTSPLSEVKSSDLNVQHTVDSGTAAGNAGVCEVKPASPSDHNLHDMIDSGTAAGHVDACEVKSESTQKTNQGQEKSNMKLTPERSGNVGSFYVEEDWQMSANMLEGFGNYMMLGDQTSSECTDVHEDTDLHQGSVEQFCKLDDYHCVISQSATTCLDASPGVKNTDGNTNVNVENILDEVHSASFEDSDETPVQFLKTIPLSEVEPSDLDADKMVVTGTDTKNAYTNLLNKSVSPNDVLCNVGKNVQIGADKEQVEPSQKKMIEFSPKLFNYPGTPTNVGIGFCGLEENLEIGVNKENIDPNEDVIYAEPSAMVMSDNEDLIQAVSEELGNKLMEENLEIGVNRENIDSNEDVIYAEPSVMVMSDSEDLMQAVSKELGNNLMEEEVAKVEDKFDLLEDFHGSVNPGGTNSTHGSVNPGGTNSTHGSNIKADPFSGVETSDLDLHKISETATSTNADTKVDPCQENMEFSPKLFNNPETLTNCGIGLRGLEENLEIGVNKENNDPNEDVMHEEPSALVMSDNDDLIRAVSEELGNDLVEDEVANVGDKFDLLEDIPGSVNPGSMKNADLNTYVTGGDILDEVHSSSFEDSDVTPVQFLKTNPLREADTSDLDLHKMFETATTATKNADTSGVKFESSTKMSLSLTPEKMNGFCDVDESLLIGVNKGNMDPSDEVLHAEPSLVVMSDNEEVDTIYQMAALEACEEEMLKSSEKTCMVADPEESIGFSLNNFEASASKGSEAETYFKSTALGDVMETCNMEGSMQTDMMEGENRQEENQGYSVSWKNKGSDVDDNSSANSDEEVIADELVPAVPQSSEMESCDFGLQQLLAQDIASEDEESSMIHKNMEIAMIKEENNREDCVSAQRVVSKLFDNSDVRDDIGRVGAEDENQALSASRKKKSDVDETSGANSDGVMELSNFGLQQLFAQDTASRDEESSKMHKEMEILVELEDCIQGASKNHPMIEEEKNQEDCISVQQVVSKVFDKSDVHDDIGRVRAEEENQAYSAGLKRKRSDVDDASGANSIEQVKADELVPAVPQSSEMDSCNFSLQQLFAQAEITMIEEEHNQEDCVSAQQVVKFFDNSDVHDVGRDRAKEENQAYSASRKRISDADDASSASSDEQVPVVPQSSMDCSMDSCNFSLQPIFAQDTESGDQDVCLKKLDSPSKATLIASGEKNIIFTPKFNESSMMHKETEIAMIEEENSHEYCISAQREVSKFLDTSDDGIDLDGAKDDQVYWASRKRKMSDVDDTSGGNSDEEVKADELVPAVLQSSGMESNDFGLPQLFAQDTASGDEDAYQKKLDSSSKGTPTASGEKSIIFTPKLQESSMMRKKMKIEMSLSVKPATRDSVGNCDRKENIKTDKKEDISSTVLRNKFAKRLPLQDLHQN